MLSSIWLFTVCFSRDILRRTNKTIWKILSVVVQFHGHHGHLILLSNLSL